MTKQGKSHAINDLDKEAIQSIAEYAKQLRIATGLGYEEFALHAGINRNTYFKFEKAAVSGENFTVVTLLKVIRGLDLTLSSFFKDL